MSPISSACESLPQGNNVLGFTNKLSVIFRSLSLARSDLFFRVVLFVLGRKARSPWNAEIAMNVNRIM